MASSYRRALVFAILAAGGISLAGGLPLTTIQRAAAETRDPWYRPFTPTSIWNMPIGSGARYVAANMPPTGIDFSQAFLIRTSGSDPARPLYSPSSWSSRCGGTQSTGKTVNIPDSFIVPNGGTNNTAGFLLPDGRHTLNTVALARCTAGGPAYGYQANDPNVDSSDLYGDGRLGSHGASRLSAIGGVLRTGELSGAAPINHALDLVLWAKYLCYCNGSPYRWPAIHADGYASPQSYAGSNPDLRMGSLMAIDPSATPASLGISTQVGLKLFHALQDYGGYWTDDQAYDHGRFVIDIAALGTFSWGSGEQADATNLIHALEVVANNSPNSVGGGGTTRQPMLPPFGSAPPPPPPPPTSATTSPAQAPAGGSAGPAHGPAQLGTTARLPAAATTPRSAAAPVAVAPTPTPSLASTGGGGRSTSAQAGTTAAGRVSGSLSSVLRWLAAPIVLVLVVAGAFAERRRRRRRTARVGPGVGR